jgi:acyl-CoA synthetase (AMP-forming)/AMP-acid ligase II
MTHAPTFADFAARLREFISASVAEAAVPNTPKPNEGQAAAITGTSDAKGRPASRGLPPAFERLALVLFALQFATNPPFRRLCEARRVSPETLDDWRRIPPMPTAAFKELEVTCLAPAERLFVFHSSGTTGQRPSRHFHHAASLAIYETSLLPWFARHLLGEPRQPARFLFLTPPPSAAPHSSLVHMFETVRREFGEPLSRFTGKQDDDGAWDQDCEATTVALREGAAAAQPLVLLGTAFSLVHLLDHMAARNARLSLPPGSRVMETGGYKGRARALAKAELHAQITEQLGVPASHIVCEYGMSELSSQAYDSEVSSSEFRVPSSRSDASESNRVFRFPPWARVRILSPETGREVGEGETGLICVFDLANVWSVMAVQTEDVGVRRGDGFELLGRAAQAEARGCSLMAVSRQN